MNLNFFISAFLFELEIELKKDLSYFDDVVFQFDEANTDQQIKIKIRDYILNNLKNTNSVVQISQNGDTISLEKNTYIIYDVKVPSQLSSEDKSYIKSIKKSNYTNPDLLLIISDGKELIRIPIEVKSTKNDKIPGSSIQQIEPEDWVIFIKHSDEEVLDIATGKYVDSISGTMQFPDRSPRPQVSFKNLKKWNDEFRKFDNGLLEFINDEENEEKFEILYDWQMSLANRWLEVLGTNKKVTGEPWFNNNIRKFALLSFEYYDSLSVEEKQAYKEFIQANIDGDNSEE